MGGIEACAQKCGLQRRERERKRERAAPKHGGGSSGRMRGESSGEVGKSVRRWSWERKLVTSSGVVFTAPVALILTSCLPLRKLHLPPHLQPPLSSVWTSLSVCAILTLGEGISSCCWRCRADNEGIWANDHDDDDDDDDEREEEKENTG